MHDSRRRQSPPQYLELEIEDLALGGRGVAHHEGKVVLVEHGFPGDLVKARVYRRRRTLWEAHAEEILSASPWREPPRCPHVGTCGGCKLQGLAYGEQLAAKTSQVTEALRRLGGIDAPPMRDSIPAPEIFEYRNKMEFSFAVDRETGQLICGMHYAGRFDRVFDLQECHLVPPTYAAVVQAARAFLRERRVPAYDQRTHEGHARFLVVRRSVASGELVVNFVTTSADYALKDGFVTALTGAVTEVTGIVHSVSDRKAQVAVGERMDVWFGRDHMTERLGDLEFDLAPNAFFQTNSRQAAALYDLVVRAAEPSGDELTLDLYCGTGTIGVYVAPRVKAVLGVDSIAESVDNARANAARNGTGNASFECADVLDWLKQFDAAGSDDARLIVIDPPRAGLHPDVPKLLVNLKPRRIVYVSCNPAALARDAQLLGNRGYAITQVTPIDMFPHTAHIESVAVFDPRT